METAQKLASNVFKDTKSTALTLGVSTVILTHVGILVLPESGDKNMMTNHAIINLVAAGVIVWGSGFLE